MQSISLSSDSYSIPVQPRAAGEKKKMKKHGGGRGGDSGYASEQSSSSSGRPSVRNFYIDVFLDDRLVIEILVQVGNQYITTELQPTQNLVSLFSLSKLVVCYTATCNTGVICS